MSMNTYPLDEKCALWITPELAAAILVKSFHDDEALREGLPKQVRDRLETGSPPYEIASDPSMKQLLHDGGWDDVSDAYDTLDAENVAGMVYCTEFTGHAETPDGMPGVQDAFVSVESRFVAMLVPDNGPEMFKAAYPSMDDLVREYRARLEGYTGPGVPWERLVMDVSGTYIC